MPLAKHARRAETQTVRPSLFEYFSWSCDRALNNVVACGAGARSFLFLHACWQLMQVAKDNHPAAKTARRANALNLLHLILVEWLPWTCRHAWNNFVACIAGMRFMLLHDRR